MEIIGNMATRANVKTVVLSHLRLRSAAETITRLGPQSVRKHFSGPVLIAKDPIEF